MHIFSATMTAAPGQNREASRVMPQLRDAAIAANGVPTSAWAVIVGAPHGTFGLSARVDGTEQMLEAFSKLDANADWNDLTERSGHIFTGPAETNYATVVAATTDDPGEPPLVSITRGIIAPGQVQAAMTGAGKVLELVTEITGLDGMLTLSSAGPMNQVSWMFGVESGAAGDAAEAALAADPAYLELVDSIGPHFSAGSGERFLIARI